MAISRRRLLLLVGIVIGFAVVPLIVYAIAGTVPVSDGVSLQAPSGMNATVTGDIDAQLEDAFPNSDTVEWTTESGNITFTAAGTANATVAKGDILGTFTILSNIDAAQNAITADPEDKQSVTVASAVTDIEWPAESYIDIDDGTVDMRYTVSNGNTGNVTIAGLPANSQVAAVDAATNNYLDSAQTDGSGEITYDELSDGSHDVYFQSHDPITPELANPSPTGELSSEPTQLSIDVSDPEFDDGDTVTVTIDLDGSQQKQTTISSNQTVTASIPQSGKTGGQHDWTVTAEDKFGEINTEDYSYKVPNTLYIRNELNHSELIDSPILINGTFYGEELIFINDSVDDGTVNMTGLPVGREWIFEARPSADNWTERTLYVQSIYEQESIYLLNTSTTDTIESRFVLNDPTGQYDASSVLFIQRGVNVSGNISWQTMFSDRFGVEGVTTELDQGIRYRIKVRNEEGDEQIVGPYRADVSETVDVVPGAPTIELGEFNDGWAANAELDNATLEYRYSDPANDTDKLTVWIHRRGDPGNNLVANATYFNLGNASAQHTLSPAEKNKTWIVKFIVDRDGEKFTRAIAVSNRQPLFAQIGSNWQLIVGVGSLFLFAGVFSLLNAAIGAVIVALVGGLWWWIGLLDGATTGFAVILAILIAAIGHLRKGSGP